jgi:hypothetical protein
MTRLDYKDTAASRVIADFLAEHVQPQAADWKLLIDQHPELAGEIADVAFLRGEAQPMGEPSADATMNRALFDATVSQAVSMLYDAPSTQLVEVEKAVAAVRGPGARKLAQEVGVGPHVALLNSVLAGSVQAPRQLLARLADKFQVSSLALVEFFRRSFAVSSVPAFKAEEGKPGVTLEPKKWREAVQSLRLSEAETARLLELDD